jgi:hypothetical protein
MINVNECNHTKEVQILNEVDAVTASKRMDDGGEGRGSTISMAEADEDPKSDLPLSDGDSFSEEATEKGPGVVRLKVAVPERSPAPSVTRVRLRSGEPSTVISVLTMCLAKSGSSHAL